MIKRNRSQTLVNQQRAEVIRELAGKASDHEIADKLQITVNNLHYIARRNGLSLRFYNQQWTSERQRQLLDMVNSGATSAECAKTFRVTRSAIDIQLGKLRKQGAQVRDRSDNLGGYRQGHQWLPHEDEMLKAMWPDHKTRHIAEALGVTLDAVKCRVITLRKHGVLLEHKTGGRDRKVK